MIPKLERLTKKYHLEVKTKAEMVDMLKQVTSTTKKIERYEACFQQFRQNHQLNSNQRRLYKSIEEGNNYSTKIPLSD